MTPRVQGWWRLAACLLLPLPLLLVTVTAGTAARSSSSSSSSGHHHVERDWQLALSGSGAAASRSSPSFASVQLAHDADTRRLETRSGAADAPPLFRLLPEQRQQQHQSDNQEEGEGEEDKDHVLVGARNALYNLSFSSLAEIRRIDWAAGESHTGECVRKGQPEEKCANFIRHASWHAGRLLVCGTHAFAPRCRTYAQVGGREMVASDPFDGVGLAPFDPRQNASFLRVGKELYAATTADFGGRDALIHRRDITATARSLGIRTARAEPRVLNEPHFVSVFQSKEHVYVLMRETVLDDDEASGGGGAGGGSGGGSGGGDGGAGRAVGHETVQTMVARVCKRDAGGRRPYEHEWTSYGKVRLRCAIPGAVPLDFDRLEAVTTPIDFHRQQQQQQAFFAVFQTPLAGLAASAICGYSPSDVTAAFRPDDGTSLRTESGEPLQPGRCYGNSTTTLKDEDVAYLRTHPLLRRSIDDAFGGPVYIHHGPDGLTAIAVERGARALDDKPYDILYAGTSAGRILKVVRHDDGVSKLAAIWETAGREPIRQLRVVARKSNTRLIVVSDSTVLSTSVAHCSPSPPPPSPEDIVSDRSRCMRCVESRDPHCAWHPKLQQCVALRDFDSRERKLLRQSIALNASVSLCESESDALPMPAPFVAAASMIDPAALRPAPSRSARIPVLVTGDEGAAVRLSSNSTDCGPESPGRSEDGWGSLQLVGIGALVGSILSILVVLAVWYARHRRRQKHHHRHHQHPHHHQHRSHHLQDAFRRQTLQASVPEKALIHAYGHDFPPSGAQSDWHTSSTTTTSSASSSDRPTSASWMGSSSSPRPGSSSPTSPIHTPITTTTTTDLTPMGASTFFGSPPPPDLFRQSRLQRHEQQTHC